MFFENILTLALMNGENKPPATHPIPAPEIQYFEGFKFLFTDKNWPNNLLIGSVLNLIPFVGPIVVMGWFCEIMQRLVKKTANPIPKLDFSDFVYYLQRGLIPFVVALIVTLPITFLVMIAMFIVVGAGSLFASQSQSPQVMVPIMILGAIAAFLVIFIPMAVLSNAVLTRAYLTEDFGKSLQIGKIFRYAKETWLLVFKAWLVYFPVTFLMMIAGMITLYVGMFPAILISNLAWVYLSYQIYNANLAQGGEEIPPKPNGLPIPSEVAAGRQNPPPPAPPK